MQLNTGAQLTIAAGAVWARDNAEYSVASIQSAIVTYLQRPVCLAYGVAERELAVSAFCRGVELAQGVLSGQRQ